MWTYRIKEFIEAYGPRTVRVYNKTEAWVRAVNWPHTSWCYQDSESELGLAWGFETSNLGPSDIPLPKNHNS